MNRNKIRKYPPIVVTLVVIAALAIAAVTAIAREAAATPKGAAKEERQRVILTVAPEVAINAVGTTVTNKPTPEPEEIGPPYQSTIHSRDLDGEDSEMLMKIAMAEAEGESVEGKALVMLVVLNYPYIPLFKRNLPYQKRAG